MGARLYHALAIAILALHLLWIAWVIFGALLTRRRPWLRTLHILSLVYGIFIEVAVTVPCPLTLLEQWLETRAGIQAYQGSFLVHYLEAVIYPDISVLVLVAVAVAICAFNLGMHLVRYWRRDAAGW